LRINAFLLLLLAITSMVSAKATAVNGIVHSSYPTNTDYERVSGTNSSKVVLSALVLGPEESVTLASIDSSGGFIYLVTTISSNSPGFKIVKIRISNFSRVSELDLDSVVWPQLPPQFQPQQYDSSIPVNAFWIDAGRDYGYLTGNIQLPLIIRVRLSNLTYAGMLDLNSDDGVFGSQAIIDSAHKFAYFLMDRGPPYFDGNPPTRIVKVNLSNFTRAGALDMYQDYGFNISNALFDPTTGLAYFGAAQNGFDNIIRVRLSDLTIQGNLSLPNQFANELGQEAIDSERGFAYFKGSAGLVKIRLSDFREVATYADNYGTVCSTSVTFDLMGTDSDYLYGACSNEIDRISLQDFAFAGALKLGGEQANATIISTDGQTISGVGFEGWRGVEGPAVIDTQRGYMYISGNYPCFTCDNRVIMLIRIPLSTITGYRENVVIQNQVFRLNMVTDYRHQIQPGEWFSINLTFPVRRTDQVDAELSGNSVIMIFNAPFADPNRCAFSEPSLSEQKAATTSTCQIPPSSNVPANYTERITFSMQGPATPTTLIFNASVVIRSNDEGLSRIYAAYEIVKINVGTGSLYLSDILTLATGVAIGLAVAYIIVQFRRRRAGQITNRRNSANTYRRLTTFVLRE